MIHRILKIPLYLFCDKCTIIVFATLISYQAGSRVTN